MHVTGVCAAALTPRRNGEADVGALLELIDWLCAAGVKGIALLGSTGEFTSLSLDERARITYLATKRSRVPVLAGVAHTSLGAAVELGREACSAGVAGVLLLPPYFFRYDQDDIREFYLEFARQMDGRVPIYLYNIPFFTNEIAADTAAALLETGRFAGIKDSSGDMEYLRRLQDSSSRSGFTVLAGNDSIFLEARCAGADGAVSGVACAVPELLLALDRAVTSGNTECAARLQARLDEVVAWTDRFATPVGIKIAAGLRGLKTGPLAVPLAAEKQNLRTAFEAWFQAWLPHVLKESKDV
jgi:4-hydroxy-tetrahydrodipicolinate synthase